MQSQLAKYQQTEPMTADELLHKKKQAWCDKIALVLSFEQLATLSNSEYNVLIKIGNREYGAK